MDLNADLGEGFGRWELTDDAALMEVVTSANVACGFHAGDPGTMVRTCELAAARGVVVGLTSATATWWASAAGSSTSSPPR